MEGCFVSAPQAFRALSLKTRSTSQIRPLQIARRSVVNDSFQASQHSLRMLAKDADQSEEENLITDIVQGPSQAPSKAGISTVGLSESDSKFITACYDADVNAIEKMLDDGQDPNVTDVNRRTALHFCAGNGLPTVCKKLIEMGADLDVQDMLGLTPLHMAAGYKKVDTVQQLVKAGADANIASLQGQLPVEVAEAIFEKIPEKRFFVPNEEHSRMRQIVDILDEATEYEEEEDDDDGENNGNNTDRAAPSETVEETDSAKFVVRVKPKGEAPTQSAPPEPPADVQVTIRVKGPNAK